MTTTFAKPTQRRRAALLLGAAALALSCVCPLTLPGGGATATPPPGVPATAPGQATAPPGAPTLPPGQAAEATATLAPTPEGLVTIPPTASVGEDYHQVEQGQIDTPGQLITYTFEAAPGQEFYFGIVQAESGVALTPWQVADEAGEGVFAACLGCGDPGAFVLSRGGVYTVTVGRADDTGVGAYQFVIASVRVHYFEISLGGPIAEGQPGPGAGGIETPGARDMYTFEATAGQEVYFGGDGSTTVPLVHWHVVSPDALDVFASCLGCGNPGVFTLATGGQYTVIVGSGPGLETGTYALTINPVRTDEFAIAPGDPIGEGIPGPGAGNIETPGARDIYTFTASPGQQVTFAALDSGAVALVEWRLEDETGAEVFSTCLGCTSPGALTLERGGIYTLTVGGRADGSTGTYQLDIH